MKCRCEECDCKEEVDTTLYISAFLVGHYLLEHGHHPKIVCKKCKAGKHYDLDKPKNS